MGGKEGIKGTAITLRGEPIIKNGFVIGYESVKTVVHGIPGTEIYFSDAKKAVAGNGKISG